jgi:hypothetical protein
VYKSNFQKRAFFKVSIATSTAREDLRNVHSPSRQQPSYAYDAVNRTTAVNPNEVELFILRVCINDKQMPCALFDFLQHRHSSPCPRKGVRSISERSIEAVRCALGSSAVRGTNFATSITLHVTLHARFA